MASMPTSAADVTAAPISTSPREPTAAPSAAKRDAATYAADRKRMADALESFVDEHGELLAALAK